MCNKQTCIHLLTHPGNTLQNIHSENTHTYKHIRSKHSNTYTHKLTFCKHTSKHVLRKHRHTHTQQCRHTQHIQTQAYAGIHTTITQTKGSSGAHKRQCAKYRHIILPAQDMDTYTHMHALTGRLFFFLSFSFSLFSYFGGLFFLLDTATKLSALQGLRFSCLSQNTAYKHCIPRSWHTISAQ